MGALDGAIENFGPFNDAMGKLETHKEMGKLCVCVCGRVLITWKIGNLMGQWNIWGPLMMQWANLRP